MPDLEAVGDAATGGMIAGAVERRSGEVEDGHTHERNCLNCGTALTGDYCHACGQRAHLHRSLRGFFHDLLHGVLHFEGKIWHTLPLLAWKPGELTRRYIDGQRARFVSPIALFLFSVFLMFAVVSAATALGDPATAEMRADMTREVQQQSANVAELEARRNRAVAECKPTAVIDRQIVAARRELAAVQMGQRGLAGGPVQFSDDLPEWLRAPIEKAGRNPELLFYKLRTNAYKFSWALIPISVPFLWLLFPFSRRFRLYDHMVFVTYSLSFMTLLVVAAMLLGAVGASAAAGLAVFFIPPFHMYRQLKGAYGLSTAGAAWRAFLLTLFALWAAVVFILLLVGVGLFD